MGRAIGILKMLALPAAVLALFVLADWIKTPTSVHQAGTPAETQRAAPTNVENKAWMDAAEKAMAGRGLR